MATEVCLESVLGFGRFENFTGKELLDRDDGISYLVWVYNRTDIPMDARIVNHLQGLGLISRTMVRSNSKIDGPRHDSNPRNKELAEAAFQAFRASRGMLIDEVTGKRLAETIRRQSVMMQERFSATINKEISGWENEDDPFADERLYY